MKPNFYFVYIKMFIFIFFSLICDANKPNKDLTVIGSIDFNGSLSRQSIGLIDCLKDKVSINFIPLSSMNLKGLNKKVKEILTQPYQITGNVVIFEDFIHLFDDNLIKKTSQSKIKVAYSMLESTEIPLEWVNILNKHFDAVAVPDIFLINVYKNSGVKIPVFLLPLGIYIDEFLSLPEKKKPNKPFVFGSTTRFYKRKNHHILIDAFVKEFGNNGNVILKLSGGKRSDDKIFNNLVTKINNYNVKNIIIEDKPLLWKNYVNLVKSFDCLVNISGGEGFSITPRESLAASIPAIITNNSAHASICQTGFVKTVNANIKDPFYLFFVDRNVGYEFNCEVQEVQKALRDVYENYQLYLEKAQEGRKWVKQFRWPELQNKYLNLIKPQKIILGDRNEITDDYLMTDSKILYEKYLDLKKQKE